MLKLKLQSITMLVRIVLFACVATSLVACVSVNLGPKKAGRAENTRFQSPGAPFSEVKEASGDKAWQSAATGSTLSFFSECPEPSSGLESLTTEFLAVLKKNELQSQEVKFFNGREALQTVAEGTLDGIAMKVASTVFKKNGCSYMITFVARLDQFAKEEANYQSFLSGFEAP